jgi:hypothetical protein
VEQPATTELAAPVMEESPATGPTSPGGGAHDEGDSGNEGLWSVAATSTDPDGVGAGATGDAPSSVAQDPPTAVEQATTPAASTAEVRLRQAVRAQQRPRRELLQAAAVEVQEIVREPLRLPSFSAQISSAVKSLKC